MIIIMHRRTQHLIESAVGLPVREHSGNIEFVTFRDVLVDCFVLLRSSELFKTTLEHVDRQLRYGTTCEHN